MIKKGREQMLVLFKVVGTYGEKNHEIGTGL